VAVASSEKIMNNNIPLCNNSENAVRLKQRWKTLSHFAVVEDTWVFVQNGCKSCEIRKNKTMQNKKILSTWKTKFCKVCLVK